MKRIKKEIDISTIFQLLPFSETVQYIGVEYPRRDSLQQSLQWQSEGPVFHLRDIFGCPWKLFQPYNRWIQCFTCQPEYQPTEYSSGPILMWVLSTKGSHINYSIVHHIDAYVAVCMSPEARNPTSMSTCIGQNPKSSGWCRREVLRLWQIF